MDLVSFDGQLKHLQAVLQQRVLKQLASGPNTAKAGWKTQAKEIVKRAGWMNQAPEGMSTAADTINAPVQDFSGASRTAERKASPLQMQLMV